MHLRAQLIIAQGQGHLEPHSAFRNRRRARIACPGMPLLASHLLELGDEKLQEARVVGLLLGNERVVSVIAGAQHIVEAFAHVEDRVQIREDAFHLRTASGTVNEWMWEPAEAQGSAPSRLHPSCPRGA